MYGASKSEVTSHDVSFYRFPRLALLTLLALVLLTAIASAQYCTPDQCDECDLCKCNQRCCYELPELWLVNTRCAPRCRDLDNGFDCLTYKRYDRECCRWVQESRESFLAQEAMLPTLFYSHGNSLNHKNAMKSCWKIYCKMRCCPGPKRLVFWSWPAERVYKTKGLRVREMIEKNLRIKYVYAEYQGYYMAKLVNQMSLSQRVMMSGHSYGAITAAAALHYMGGGCLRGLTLEGGAPVERPNLRAGIISGAFDHDMLNLNNRFGKAFVVAEKIFVTRNIKDSTLKKWPKTSWRNRRAIGVLGVNANCLGEYRNKLCQQTMTSDVGRSHYLKPHLKSVKFVSALCCLSFPACDECPMAEADLPAEPDVITDEEIAAESSFVFGAEALDVELTDYTEDFANISLWDQKHLTEMDLADVFGNEQSFAPNVGSFWGDTENSDTVNSLVEPIADTDVESLIGPLDLDQPEQAHPLQAQPKNTQSKQAQATQGVVQPQLAGSFIHKNRWNQGGVCLALLLTGQVYVFFRKRVAAS